MLTKKDISQREYDTWNLEYQRALATLEDRERIIMDVCAQIEVEMTLVGSTAIEDRL